MTWTKGTLYGTIVDAGIMAFLYFVMDAPAWMAVFGFFVLNMLVTLAAYSAVNAKSVHLLVQAEIQRQVRNGK